MAEPDALFVRRGDLYEPTPLAHGPWAAGFLHGFATIEANTEVAYKVSDFYSAAHDGSVLWNDPALGIDWGIDPAKAVLSDKDAKAVSFAEFSSPF